MRNFKKSDIKFTPFQRHQFRKAMEDMGDTFLFNTILYGHSDFGWSGIRCALQMWLIRHLLMRHREKFTHASVLICSDEMLHLYALGFSRNLQLHDIWWVMNRYVDDIWQIRNSSCTHWFQKLWTLHAYLSARCRLTWMSPLPVDWLDSDLFEG